MTSRSRVRVRSTFAVTTSIVAVLLVAGLAAGCSSDATTSKEPGADRKLSGVINDPLLDVSTQSLPEALTGTPFPFVAKSGHLLLVYFGYTDCPDVCPTTLFDLKAALKKTSAATNKKIDVAMATVDPRRDKPELITGYVQGFFPAATALRTDDDAVLRAVTTAFGATYQANYYVSGGVDVIHSAYLYAVDDKGLVVLAWPFGSASKDIALDLEQLLASQGEKP